MSLEHLYHQFKVDLQALIAQCFPAGQYQVGIIEIAKSTGIREALIIDNSKSETSPAVFLEPLFGAYLAGDSLNSIVNQVRKVVAENRCPKIEVKHLTDYKWAKECLRVKLVNAENNNKAYLSNGPYRNSVMGAVVPYLHLGKHEQRNVSTQVSYKMLEHYPITEQELFDTALANTQKNCPEIFTSIGNVLNKLMGEEVVQESGGESLFYVLTNQENCSGAATVLYPGVLEMVREKIGEEFYILPSSTHEVIILPKTDGGSPKELRDMVRDINKSQVDPVDILSNEVFEYRDKDQKLRKCPIKEKEMER